MEDNCPFCDRKKFEERLVAELTDYWIVATLGQISDGGYLLLIPKAHVPCLGAMTRLEIAKFVVKVIHLSRILEIEYGFTPIIFEHGMVDQTVKHAHLHLVPVSCPLTSLVHKDFPNNQTESIASWPELNDKYSANPRPYLLCQDPYQPINLLWDPPAPAQYLRIVLAQAIGVPGRANWRNMDPETDRRLWTETVLRTKKYFISPQ